ncbi:MAG: YbaB/EbfC family nucleoid-associated protein, partial [Bacilli bacterium]|nr:YbaB/EbfC family nucleoid-associated protein [Bacilli bacterium]
MKNKIHTQRGSHTMRGGMGNMQGMMKQMQKMQK